MKKDEAISKARLQQIAAIIGYDALARLLEIKSVTLTRMLRGTSAIPSRTARRAQALDTILERALQIMQPATVVDWLEGSEPTFGFGSPIHVLFLQGPAPLFSVLDRLESGGYA